MDTRSTAALSETEIRNTLEAWAEPFASATSERIFSCYSPDIVAFDAIAQLQFRVATLPRALGNLHDVAPAR